MNNVWMIDPLDIFKDEILTITGGATPTLTSLPKGVRQITKLNVFVANAGTSTSCVITIYGKPSADSLLSSSLAVFTLGAGTAEVPYTAGRYIEKVPSFVYAVITNADAVAGHTAIVTVTLDMVR